jgi:hypothetical protein
MRYAVYLRKVLISLHGPDEVLRGSGYLITM